MYICICNTIKDRELRDIASQGETDATTAFAALGCQPRCGRCLAWAETIVAEVQAETTGQAARVLATEG